MADSSLIPDILDDIVNDEIIPLLPWHIRPVLMALSKAWRNVLDAIGVQGGNKLDPIHGERMARATRLKQPLKCRLAVEYNHTYRDRYDSSKKRWIRAARMLPPNENRFKWTWCVEYDEQSEKQLWIYIFPQYMGEALNLYKLRVPLTCRAWDDTMLSDGEVECELVDRTPVDQSFQPIEPVNDENVPTLYVRRFYGFHRSDSTDFQDIPH